MGHLYHGELLNNQRVISGFDKKIKTNEAFKLQHFPVENFPKSLRAALWFYKMPTAIPKYRFYWLYTPIWNPQNKGLQLLTIVAMKWIMIIPDGSSCITLDCWMTMN